ncbi:hypothetical protein GWI33_015247 [Rhynchophorus ferrugineus]|uniref:Uncharacterized protein n=1 Tax=Rhynchophorus ferrugineus TaxID=354439 RepID=A0A834MBM4_RHYFE|nr:hypothetical protein GWI33_015247 [Rhynchophorus ferrugineus]
MIIEYLWCKQLHCDKSIQALHSVSFTDFRRSTLITSHHRWMLRRALTLTNYHQPSNLAPISAVVNVAPPPTLHWGEATPGRRRPPTSLMR